MNGYLHWPYATKAIIQHEFDTDHLNIWLTFAFPMNTQLQPPLSKWLVIVDDVEKTPSSSAWQDKWTLLLTVHEISANPARVLVKYEGPSPLLVISWKKQFEPWGPILSMNLVGVSAPPKLFDAWTDFLNHLANTTQPWVLSALYTGSCTAVNSTSFNHPGMVRLRSHTTNANSGSLYSTYTNCLILNGSETTEMVFRLSESHANTIIRFGFQNSLTQSSPIDGVYFNISNLTLSGITANDGTSANTATTYTLSVPVWYRAKISLNADATVATFELFDESGTLLWSDTVSTKIPTTRTTGHVLIAYNTSPGGISRILIEPDYMNFSINRTLVR